MGWGTVVPNGRLPVYSVDTAEEAQKLAVMVCKRDMAGNLYAPELAEMQTLENLQVFSDRLAQAHAIFVEHGLCKCKTKGISLPV